MTKEQEKYAREASLKIGGAIVCVATSRTWRSYPVRSRREAFITFALWDDAFCIAYNGVIMVQRKG